MSTKIRKHHTWGTECSTILYGHVKRRRDYVGKVLEMQLSGKRRREVQRGGNEEPCTIRHQWQHLTHKVLTTCIVTRML